MYCFSSKKCNSFEWTRFVSTAISPTVVTLKKTTQKPGIHKCWGCESLLPKKKKNKNIEAIRYFSKCTELNWYTVLWNCSKQTGCYEKYICLLKSQTNFNQSDELHVTTQKHPEKFLLLIPVALKTDQFSTWMLLLIYVVCGLAWSCWNMQGLLQYFSVPMILFQMPKLPAGHALGTDATTFL